MAWMKHLRQDLTRPGRSANLNSLSLLLSPFTLKRNANYKESCSVIHSFRWKKNRNHTIPVVLHMGKPEAQAD